MSVNVSIGMVGAAPQANRTTPASTPAFAHGLKSGSPFSVSRTTSVNAVACGVPADTDAYVENIETGASFTTLGYPDIVGLYYFGALGDDVATASGTHKKHVFTVGDSLPYLTVFGQVGASDYGRVDNCLVDSINCEFSGNSPLTFTVTAKGTQFQFLESNPFEGVEPSCFNGYFIPTDCTFQLDTGGQTPVAAEIMSGNIQIARSVASRYGLGSVMPSRVFEGKCVPSCSFVVVPDDMSDYRKTVTGSANGTKPSGRIVYGSFDCTFQHSEDPTLTLRIHANKVPFSADMPEVDPDGNAAEFTFSADTMLVAASGGTPITVEIVNDVDTYQAD